MSEEETKTYELWEGDGYTFFPEDNESIRKLLPANAKLIWTVEADNWESANKACYEHMGWEPYQPMSDQ